MRSYSLNLIANKLYLYILKLHDLVKLKKKEWNLRLR